MQQNRKRFRKLIQYPETAPTKFNFPTDRGAEFAAVFGAVFGLIGAVRDFGGREGRGDTAGWMGGMGARAWGNHGGRRDPSPPSQTDAAHQPRPHAKSAIRAASPKPPRARREPAPLDVGKFPDNTLKINII